MFYINSIMIDFDGVSMRSVVVYFNKRDENQQNYINGNVQLTVDEYLQNASNIQPILLEKINAFINEGTEQTPEEPQV